MSFFPVRFFIAAILLVLAPHAVNLANANTISIQSNDGSPITLGSVGDANFDGYLCLSPECMLSSNVFVSTDFALSSTLATAVNFNPANAAREAEILNSISGTTSFATGVQTDTGGVATLAFSIAAEFFSLKIGKNTAYFKNLSGGVLSLDYAQVDGTGSGLSHYTEFGVFAVPLPAALPLFAGGLGLLGLLGWRRRRAAA